MVLSQLSYCPTVREAGIVLRGVGFRKSLVLRGFRRGGRAGEEEVGYGEGFQAVGPGLGQVPDQVFQPFADLSSYELGSSAGPVVVGGQDLLDGELVRVGPKEVALVSQGAEEVVGEEGVEDALDLPAGEAQALGQGIEREDGLSPGEAAGDEDQGGQAHPAGLDGGIAVEASCQDVEVLGGVGGFGSEEDDRPGELDRDHEEEREGEASVDDVDVPEELDVGAEALAQDLQEDAGEEPPGERVSEPHGGVGDHPVEGGEPHDGRQERDDVEEDRLFEEDPQGGALAQEDEAREGGPHEERTPEEEEDEGEEADLEGACSRDVPDLVERLFDRRVEEEGRGHEGEHADAVDGLGLGQELADLVDDALVRIGEDLDEDLEAPLRILGEDPRAHEGEDREERNEREDGYEGERRGGQEDAVLVGLPEGDGEVAGEPAREAGPPPVPPLGERAGHGGGLPGVYHGTDSPVSGRWGASHPNSSAMATRRAFRAGSSPWFRKIRCGVP